MAPAVTEIAAGMAAAANGSNISSADSENSGLILACIFGVLIGPIVLWTIVIGTYRLIRHRLWASWKERRERKKKSAGTDAEKGDLPREETTSEGSDESRVEREVEKGQRRLVKGERMNEGYDGATGGNVCELKGWKWELWKSRFMRDEAEGWKWELWKSRSMRDEEMVPEGGA